MEGCSDSGIMEQSVDSASLTSSVDGSKENTEMDDQANKTSPTDKQTEGSIHCQETGEQKGVKEDTEAEVKENEGEKKEDEEEENVNETDPLAIRAKELKKKYFPKIQNTPEATFEAVEEVIGILHGLESYDNKLALECVKVIARVYSYCTKHRKKACNKMIELNFHEFTMKSLHWFNEKGVFVSDDVWFPYYYTLKNMMNFTDASLELGLKLGEAGMIQFCLTNLSHEPYINNIESKNIKYVIKSSLCILQNVAKISENKHIFQENDGKNILQPYTTNEDDFLKAMAMMTLTNILDESEQMILQDTDSIGFMLNGVSKAIKAKGKRRYRGLTPCEIVECLARMAVNDDNKVKIVEHGALPIFAEMLTFEKADENAAVCKTLWNLAFDKEVKQKIIEEEGIIESLERLKDSEDPKVKKAANGALWKLVNEDKHEVKTTDDSDAKLPHIFISYNWQHQETIIQLKDKLKNEGFRVWIDVEQMGGSTLESMALGVEEAAVVIVAMSEKYKESPNCRTEAEYTFQLKKPIVPIMMQRHYKPDGWLGMLVGAKLYINFDGKFTFQHACNMLLKELNNRGKELQDGVDGNGTSIVPQVAAPANNAPKKSVLLEWNTDKVKEWLKDNDLEHLIEIMENYNGKLLRRFQGMREEAPEFFYQTLKTELNLKVIDILKLTDAMDSLPR